MTIGIDIREAREGGAGKGRYAFEIAKALILRADGRNFVLFGSQTEPPIATSEHVQYVRIKGRGPLWHFNLWRHLRHHPVEWMLSPTSFIYPAIAPRSQKTAIIIHDLIAFLHADTHPWFPTLVERFTLRKALRKAHVVGCISEATKTDLLDLFPEVAKKNIVIAPPAPPSDMVRTEARSMDLPSDFILSVGTVLPRKNITLLLRVMEKLHATHPELHLVIAGQVPPTGHPSLTTLSTPVRDKITFLGRVSDTQLRELYSRAKVFAFPSLYEGFGIPPLEAMACGCPVIASNRSSVPEAVGNAALLADPDDLDAWVRGIGKLTSDPVEAEHYRERGYAWVKRFSWEESACKLSEAMRSET